MLMLERVKSSKADGTISGNLHYCIFCLVWLVGFYGISTFVGYLTPNPFLCK